MRAVVVVAAVAAVLMGGPAAPARAAARASFGIGPANVHALDGRPYFNILSTRGAAVTEHVAVVNNASAPVSLRVYAVDAIPTAAGGADLAAATAVPISAGAWIAVETPDASGNITVGPRATTILSVAVQVPADATAGDHEAGIVAALTTMGANPQGQRVNLEQRVAVRAFFRIAGVLRPRLVVDRFHATYHPTADPVGTGSLSIRYRIRNTGNVKLGAQPRVDFRGLLGIDRAAGALTPVAALLPGASVTRSVTLRGVWPQFEGQARVRLTPLAAAGDANPQLAPTEASRRVWTLPLATALFVALVAGAGYTVWQRRRKAA